MTYCKLGTEFFDECADAGLSDAAVRTHVEAITWLYRVERFDMRIGKHLVRRFASSDQHETAIKDLVAVEFWHDGGDAWVVEHHRNIVIQSLMAQVKHRDQERERQRRKRARSGTDVDSNVGPNVAETQSVSQSVPKPQVAEGSVTPAPTGSDDVSDDASADGICPRCTWPHGSIVHRRKCESEAV